MRDEINPRLQMMLARGATAVVEDRLNFVQNNVRPRGETSSQHENSMQDVDEEVLRTVEAELMGDRTSAGDPDNSIDEIDEDVLQAIEAELMDDRDRRDDHYPTARDAVIPAVEDRAPARDFVVPAVEERAPRRGEANFSHEQSAEAAEERAMRNVHVEAAKWYQLGAEQDYESTQKRLGVMYHQGDGASPDSSRNDAEVAKWRKMATEEGVPSAQINLGYMYAKGNGVPQDFALAHMWFNLAAAAGDADAVSNRDFVAERMTADQIAEAQRFAREWTLKSRS